MEKLNLRLNDMPGKFIATEGIDLSGKSTQTQRIKSWLIAYQKLKVILTKEPTEGDIGKKIRAILKDKEVFDKTDPFYLQELFARDSRIHVQNVIFPALKLGKIVCSDRFRSSLVFGAHKGNQIEIEMLMEMNQRYLGNYFIWPDAIFIFDISPQVAIERGKKQGRVFDEMEKLETLEAVRDNYLLLANLYPNCHIINAERTLEEVFTDVRTVIEALLTKKST
jgi:dTMP kinase